MADPKAATVLEPTEKTSSDDLYWIHTAPVSDASSSSYGSLVVRYHGGGVPAIVLTPSPPKFLRFEMTSKGQQIATSWREDHAGRFLGIQIGPLISIARPHRNGKRFKCMSQKATRALYGGTMNDMEGTHFAWRDRTSRTNQSGKGGWFASGSMVIRNCFG